MGKRTAIDVILLQEDTSGEVFFKKIDNLFEIRENEIPKNVDGTTAPHTIELGKGRNYLVFKLQSRPYLYLMATCSYEQFFYS